MESLVGILGVAVVTGVLAFATTVVQHAWKDVEFYRGQLLPAVERNTETVKDLKETVDKARALRDVNENAG